MIKESLTVVAVAGGLVSPRASIAYEIPTHQELTYFAISISNLADAALQRRLGIENVMNTQIFTSFQRSNDPALASAVPTCDIKAKMTLPQLLACGAMYEDLPGVRSLNHFYDSSRNIPLTVGVSLGLSSPDWALQDNNNDAGQLFSYRRARQYFANAITQVGPAGTVGGRLTNWAMLFRSLGQVVHHVQDMAQPQHARNDAHLDLFDPNLRNLGVFHRSRYEGYAKGVGVSKVRSQLMSNITPVYPQYAEALHRPRDFWTGGGAGLADYTNRNFVSRSTNFKSAPDGTAIPNPDFALPVPIGPSVYSVTAAFSNSVPTSVATLCANVGIQKCEMRFYGNQWLDPLTGEPQVNNRASTFSIFDEDLAAIPVAGRRRDFALNTLNFDAAYPYLIPRAVAYSAGLINYFFRGRMDIALPPEGVYAIVDHKTQGCMDSCGFGKLRMILTNATPNEDMSGGTLVAVVKFYRNTCYRPDLSGEPGGPAFAGFGCRSADEEIVVSDPVSSGLFGFGEQREISFSFAAPIPVNATDVYLQVIFQGQLGAEPGAVAVATKDISEPNYVSVANVTDMVYGYSDDRFHGFPYLGYNARDTIYNLSIAFSANGNPLATLAQMTAPGHAQLSFLTDPGDQYVDFRYASHNYTVSSFRGNVPVSEFFGVPSSSLYGRTVAFASSRGVVRNIHIFHRLPADWSLYDCVAEPELCTQSTMPAFPPDSASGWTIAFPAP